MQGGAMRWHSSLIIPVAALSLVSCLGLARSKENPGDWAVANRDSYIARYFADTRVSSGGATTLTLRVTGDHQLETQVRLRMNDDEKTAEADFATLVGADLTSQLTALRSSMPDRTKDEIFARVKIRRGKVNSEEQPELVHLAREVGALRIKPVPDSIIMFPHASYSIVVEAASGRYSFGFEWFLPSEEPGLSSSWGAEVGGDRPLVEWARSLLAAVKVEPDTRLHAH
jgi:hypothetical protein